MGPWGRGGGCPIPLQKLSAQVGPANPPAEQHPAVHEQQAVPVREVVLFSSGVGYFEHFGTVQGNGSTELRFKTDQINDILKSLVLQDLDRRQGRGRHLPQPGPAREDAQELPGRHHRQPCLAQILASFAATGHRDAGGRNRSAAPSWAWRRSRSRPATRKVVDVWVLNLLQADGEIRPLDLDRIDQIHLDDPRLQQELAKALAAVAAARDQDKKPVTIHFTGARRAARAHRLRGRDAGLEDQLSAGAFAMRKTKIPTRSKRPGRMPVKHNNNPRQNKAADGGTLQGWAIVENQTDNDWNDVQLSLVSGRPISFIEDLYQPLYVPRPVVQPELYASLQPQTYEEGMSRRQLGRVMRRQLASASPRARWRTSGGLFGGSAQSGRQPGVIQSQLGCHSAPMNPLASVLPAASGAKIGEFFEYTFPTSAFPARNRR